MNKSKFNIEAYENQVTRSVNIKIIDRIGNEKNSANDIRGIVENALNNGIKKAELFISCAGGNTIEAQGIVLELKKFDSVNITVGALAASAATYLLTQFPTSAYPESQFMIHKPALGTYGTVDQIKADLKLLENTQEIYKQAYAKAFNKTDDEIDSLWQNDYWMTANEALQLGLIQNIITADIPWDENAIALLSACGAPNIPTPKNSTTIKMDRNKIIAAAGLAADASDEAIESAIKDLRTKATASDGLQAELNEAQKNKVKTLVANAVAAKKIKADQVETYESLATANYAAAEAAINALPAITAISSEINNPEAFNAPEDRAKWTYEDYLEKAPDAYEDLLAKDQKKAMDIFNNRRK